MTQHVIIAISPLLVSTNTISNTSSCLPRISPPSQRVAGEPRQGNPTNVPLPEGVTATTLQQQQQAQQQALLLASQPPINHQTSNHAGGGSEYKPPSGGNK